MAVRFTRPSNPFMPSSAVTAKTGLLAVEFDHAEARLVAHSDELVLELPLPWLGGAKREAFFDGAVSIGERHGFTLYEQGDLLIGSAVVSFETDPRQSTLALYRRLFQAAEGRQLYRIWNYVPRINAQGADGENYHAFCEGRSQAFEAAYGAGFKQALPSASAVGCHGTQLTVVFVAGRSAPRQIENAEQVPAYDYPREHGPRPPSFSRASVASSGSNRLTFISGTAAIKGHETIAPGELRPQLDCTLHNLRLVSQAAGLGNDLAAGNPVATRFFKVYVRHAPDFATIRERLETALFRPGDEVVYLVADICRAALNVEIEATILT